MPFIFGKVKRFTPTIHELKVFQGDSEHVDEAHKMNEAITHLQRWPERLEGTEKFLVSKLLNISLPLMPFPML